MAGWSPPMTFKPDNQALAIVFLRLYDTCYGIALVFFGFSCLFLGYLVFKSIFLPRFLGVLMAFAGLAWRENLPAVLS